jgi:hypothetical protein
MTGKLEVRMRRVYDDSTTTRPIDHSQAAVLVRYLHGAR